MASKKSTSSSMKRKQDKNHDETKKKKIHTVTQTSVEVIQSIFGKPSLPQHIKMKKTATSSTSSLLSTTISPLSRLPDPPPSSSTWTTKKSPTLSRSEKNKLQMQKKRQDANYRLQEQKKDVIRKRLKRQNLEIRTQEREAKRTARQAPKVRKREQEAKKTELVRTREKELRRTARQAPEVRTRERETKKTTRQAPEVRTRERDAKRTARQAPEVRKREQEAKKTELVRTREKELRRTARQAPEVRTRERETKKTARQAPELSTREREAKRTTRQATEVRKREQEAKKTELVRTREKELRRTARQAPEVRTRERETKKTTRQAPEVRTRERDAKRTARQAPEVRKREQEAKKTELVRTREKELRRTARQAPEVRTRERETKKTARQAPELRTREREAKRTTRQATEVRKREQEAKKTELVRTREKERRRTARQVPEVRTREREAKRTAREAPEVRTREREAKRTARQDINVRTKEKERKRLQRKLNKPYDFRTLILAFHRKIEEGPIYICTCCKQLWYRQSVSDTSKTTMKTKKTPEFEQLIDKCITETTSVDGKEWICRTCLNYLKKSKMPPLAEANNMKLPEQGPLKDLNPLELTLLSPLLPFMKIHQAPRGNQYKIHGNMVIVPSDTINTVQSLPRLYNDTATIKRRLRYEHHVYSLNIRPEKIRTAAKHLSETGELYKKLNITYDLDWTGSDITSDDNSEEPINIPGNAPEPTSSNADTHDNDEENTSDKDTPIDSDEEWTEDTTTDNISGNTDTLLTPPDFIESNERDMVYSYAPAENKKPVSIFTEKTAEEQAYPGIFCGQSRQPNDKRTVSVTYGEIVKSELRNSDRRCALNVENIFFKTKKLQMKFLIDQTNIALRKVKLGDKQLTAKDVRKDSAQNLIHLDQGYKVLKTLRGSPPYFQAISKDLFAMIRQLGPATFFCTLSAAETQWIHLLKILGKVVDKKDYSDEEIENFTYQDKCRLIQSDPVTCTRHSDHSLQSFINHFMFSDVHPIGNVTDWFYRIEFQQRRSPHAHMMIWCTDAPNVNEDTNEDVCKYIDKYVTCSLPTDDDDLAHLVRFQTHKHTRTCKKRGKRQCRFNFPKPPMKRTQILKPLETEDEDEKKNIKRTGLRYMMNLCL